MADTATTSPDVSSDVNAIFQGMTNAVMARQQQERARRDALPPNLNPTYQPPLPTALTPQQPSTIPTTTPPQQSPAPWATPSQSPPAQTQPQPSQGTDPRSRQPDEYRLGQPVWHPRPGEQGYQPVSYQPPQQPQQPQPREFAGLDTNLIRDPTGRNNPGNLRIPGGAGPGGFQRFPTMQAGIQAMQNQLLRYQDGYGRNTVAGIISLYSPPNENPTGDAIQKAAARMGVDPNQRIDLHDPETMRRLTNAILAQEQSGGGNVRQVGGPGGIQDEMRLPQPDQRFAPAQPRDFGQWGREAPGFGSSRPGEMPRQSDFGRIMTGMAPLLLGIASLALRLPLSTAVTAYGAMARAQQNGQNLEYERNRTKFQDQLKEATAQQTLESREASDAFEQYGNNNPEGLQQELARVALKYNDPTMYRLAESGDLNRIYQLQQRRDQLNQGLTKTSKALEDQQDRQAQDAAVAAMDRKWRQENPNATEDEAAIAHNEHIGEAGRAGTKDPKAAGAEKEDAQPYDVVDRDTGKVTRQVRLRQSGGLSDLNGQPTTLQPNEQLGKKTGTKGDVDKPEQEGEVRNVLDKDGKRTGQQVREGKTGGYFDPDTGERTHLKPGETIEQTGKGAGSGDSLEVSKPYDIVDDKDHIVKPNVMLREARNKAGYVHSEDGSPLKLEPGQHVKQITPTTSGGGRAGAQVLRQLVGGREVLSDLQNVVRLPVGTTIGPLGTVHPGPTITDALTGDLSRKLTDQDSQLMQASMASMSRELSILMSPVYGGNWAAQQIDPLIPKSGDTIQTVVFKLARLAQSADNALEAAATSPILSNEQQEYARDLRKQISEAIPWSSSEAMDFAYRAHPKESFGAYVQRQGIHGGGGAQAQPDWAKQSATGPDGKKIYSPDGNTWFHSDHTPVQ